MNSRFSILGRVPDDAVTSMTGAERFLAAAAGKPVDATPVWFMRQAGRCLAAYRELRERHDILTMTRTPELATRITLMPVEEFGVDAAVLYADIMLPLYSMGVAFSIDPGVGPIIDSPLRTAADVEGLRRADHRDVIPEIFETIRNVRKELDGKTAVLGFCGGPFTVASYMIEGKPSKDHARTKAMIHADPALWHRLMETLTDVSIAYVEAQIDAGVQAIQLFDSWGGSLSRADYTAAALPYSRRIIEAVSDRVPTIHFATVTAHILEEMASAGCTTVSVDSRLPLNEAWARIGKRGIQGNLDPAVLLAPWEAVEPEARRVLTEAGGRDGHIFNLGHGVLPETPQDHLRRLVDLVHDVTARVPAVT